MGPSRKLPNELVDAGWLGRKSGRGFYDHSDCAQTEKPDVLKVQRNKAAAKKFLIKTMRKYGSPKIITTDKLASYGAAPGEIGIADKQLCGGRANNRCENSHLPFRRRERAMQRFKTVAALQKFTSYHAQIYNHFNHERHLEGRQSFKQKRTTALTEWLQICAS